MNNEQKKYYKTTIQVEVLSEEPLGSQSAKNLEAINYLITEGDCSGVVNVIEEKILNKIQIEKELENQGSDPNFFLDLNDQQLKF